MSKREETPADDGLRRAMHRTIRKVSADIEAFKFNTAIAALMGFTNQMAEAQEQAGATRVGGMLRCAGAYAVADRARLGR